MMAQNNDNLNKGPQKLQLSSHVTHSCSEYIADKSLHDEMKSNEVKALLESAESQKRAAGSGYFKTFEKALINRLLVDLETELQALHFDAAEEIFAKLLGHMNEAELQEILVEKGIVDLVMKNLN